MTNSAPQKGLFGRIFTPFRTIVSFPFSSELERHGRFTLPAIVIAVGVMLVAIVGFTSFLKPLYPSFDSQTAKAIAAGAIYDDFLTDDGKQIGSVRSGEEVELLAYGNGYFQIQTASGERGWVDAATIDRNFVVASDDYDELDLGESITFVRYESESHFDVVVADSEGTHHTLHNYDFFPTKAYGLPSLGLDDSYSRRYIYVTERWMKKHFAEGAAYEEMADSFYGYPVVIDNVDARTKHVQFPVRVKDFKTNLFHPKVVALFVDDKLVSYDMAEDGKIPFVERFIPLGGRIASTGLYTKLRSRPFLVAPNYNDVDDVIKDNAGGKQLSNVVRILLIVVLVAVAYFAVLAHLMAWPMVFHLVDRIPGMPSSVSEVVLILSLPIGLILLYMIYVPHWIILAVVFFLSFAIVRNLSGWFMYSHCQNCRTYYSLRSVGYGKVREKHYDEVVHHSTVKVTKRGGSVVSREVVGGHDEVIHHKDVFQAEYLVCEHCGQKIMIGIENNSPVSCTLIDEWPKDK